MCAVEFSFAFMVSVVLPVKKLIVICELLDVAGFCRVVIRTGTYLCSVDDRNLRMSDGAF